MRFPKFSKKVMVLAAAGGLAMGAAGIAAAYFTSQGTGTGSATVAGAPANFTVVVGAPSYSSLTNALQPTALITGNRSYATYTYKVTNTSDATVHLGTVTLTVTSGVTGGSVATGTACQNTWFAITTSTATSGTGSDSVVVTPDTTLKPDSDGTPTDQFSSSFTLQLVNNGTNQDGCESAHPTVKVHAAS